MEQARKKKVKKIAIATGVIATTALVGTVVGTVIYKRRKRGAKSPKQTPYRFDGKTNWDGVATARK